MVLNTLKARLSSLWRRDAPEESTATNETSEPQQTDDPASTSTSSTEPKTETTGASTDDKTLSYAEQVEYGVDETEIDDEDKVLRLLVNRGGRVDESTILEETGWTAQRLQSVVDEMEDDEQISAISVGRKRVVCRRGFEPKGYRSHLNE